MVQIEASRPRSSSSLETFLDELIGEMAADDDSPFSALAAAGRAVRGTPWAGYRNGRNRIATMAASYLHWLKPGASWTFSGALSVEGRRPLVWGGDGHSLVDLLDVAGEAQALVGPTFHASANLGIIAGVRLLRLTAPATSLLYTSPSTHQRLSETPFWFEGER